MPPKAAQRSAKVRLMLKSLLAFSLLFIQAAAQGQSWDVTSALRNPQATQSLRLWLDKDPGGVGMSQYSVGDTVTARVRPSQDAFLTLFNLASDGSVTWMGGSAGKLLRGGSVTAYTFNVKGPLGQSRVLALATRAPLPAEALMSPSAEALSERLGRALGALPRAGWVSNFTWYGVGEPGQGNPEAPAEGPQVGEYADGRLDKSLLDAYARLGALATLSLPSDPAAELTGGSWQRFGDGANQSALFHKSGQAQAYLLRGQVLERYLALGAAEKRAIPQRLGWPSGDQQTLPPNRYGHGGAYATFEGGNLYGSARGTLLSERRTA